MFNPCIECYRRFGKQYSEKCDSECEYAFRAKTLKQILLENDGCLHCKHRNLGDTAHPDWCDNGGCDNYKKYELEINKVVSDYKLEECTFMK